MMKAVIAAVLLTVATVSAQTCKCIPKQMSAGQGVILHQAINGKVATYMIEQNITFDFDKQLAGGHQMLHTAEGHIVPSTFLVDMKTNTMYSASQGKCTRFPAVPMHRCPTDMTFLGEVEYGITHKMPVEAFVLNIKPEQGFKGYGQAHMTLEKDSCFPVVEVSDLAFTLDDGTKIEQSMTINTYDGQLSVVDPKMLDMPEACKHL